MLRIVCSCILLGALTLVAGCVSTPSVTSAVDGLYVTPKEVRGYQNDRLELGNGHFRYWHSSDTVVIDEHGRRVGPKYPIRGAFRVDGRRITFSSEEVDPRYIDTLNGHAILWTLSSRRIWQRQHKIYDYGVLVRVADRIVDQTRSHHRFGCFTTLKCARGLESGEILTSMARNRPNQAMERTARSFASSSSMKLYRQLAATRHPASRRSSCSR